MTYPRQAWDAARRAEIAQEARDYEREIRALRLRIILLEKQNVELRELADQALQHLRRARAA